MPSPEHALWFAEEIKPYEPALRAYLMKRFPSLPDHDDVVQESYVRVVRARAAGRLAYPKAFLFTAARNLAIDFIRSRRFAPHEGLLQAEELPAPESADDLVSALEREHELQVLLEAVTELPERCQQVMILRHIHGLSFEEIGERLGMAPNTARVHAVKGLKDCKQFFKRRGLLGGTEGKS